MTMLTVREVAERLLVSPDTVRRLLRSGEPEAIEAVKVGRQWRIPVDALEAYLERRCNVPRRPSGTDSR